MDSITIENFRCFGAPQSARIAPLTVFVGNNGTGKSTALAAIRSLWDACFGRGVPDLQAFPHEFGPHASVLHRLGDMNKALEPEVSCVLRPESFDAIDTDAEPFQIKMRLGRKGFGTAERDRRILQGDHFVAFPGDADSSMPTAVFGVEGEEWSVWDMWDRTQREHASPVRSAQELVWLVEAHGGPEAVGTKHWPLLTSSADDASGIGATDAIAVLRLLDAWVDRTHVLRGSEAFVLAADRCRPRHTYDPDRGEKYPSGFDAPMYLASRFPRHRTHATPIDDWERQHTLLECFGIEAGIFDSVKVHHLGDSAGDPYQIHVLMAHDGAEGEDAMYRNLADAGRGAGQSVIVATELLRTDFAPISLIEHPDAHLSPRAQRALGELVCKIAVQRGTRQRLIIETSGDLLAETVHECAERSSHPLKPEDVSIVAFKREGAEIHLRDAWADWSL